MQTSNKEANSSAAPRHTAPLSPHLSVYKPQLTSVLSILHRMTGVSLALGSLLVCIWLLSIWSGESAFLSFQGIMSSWFGQFLLFAWSWALIYHLCNGVRHLFWDMGMGLELEDTYRSGKIVVAVSIITTLIIWTVAS